MRYTMATGVERPLSSRFTDSYRFLLPLLLLLVLVIAVGLRHSSIRQPAKPLTLGIYTIKSGHKSSGQPGGQSNGQGASASVSAEPTLNNNFAATAPASYLQGGSGGGLASGNLQSAGGVTPPAPTGGMGGGGGSTGPVSTGTIVCSDLLSAAQLCTACTPPVTLVAGQKALLYTDGSCVVIN
jgi:hypothetical protein